MNDLKTTIALINKALKKSKIRRVQIQTLQIKQYTTKILLKTCL